MSTSKRQFRISGFENFEAFYQEISFDMIIARAEMGSQPEFIYSLQDRLDDILDMRLGDSMVISLNRDHSKGNLAIIARTM